MGACFVNIHTHKRTEGVYVLDISDGKRCETDEFCSFGIHPMFIREEDRWEEAEKIIKEKNIIAVGEAGLDRNGPLAMEEQVRWFECQIVLAENRNLPLIIHCVRAFPELLALYKKHKPRQAWIIHGYNNNREILVELLRHGLYVSAGKKLFTEDSNIRRLLPEIPLSRLFMETDDSDYGIRQVYEESASLLNMKTEELKASIYDNFCMVFSVSGFEKGIDQEESVGL